MFAPKVLASEFRGVLSAGSQPLAGQAVEQEVTWLNTEQTFRASAVTDARGQFSLPAVTGRSLMASLLPGETVIRQRIVTRHQDREWVLWLFTKRDYRADSEIEGISQGFVCDLDRPPGGPGPRHGMCIPRISLNP